MFLHVPEFCEELLKGFFHKLTTFPGSVHVLLDCSGVPVYARAVEEKTLNPKALNPKPQTPKPYMLNPKPLNPKPL